MGDVLFFLDKEKNQKKSRTTTSSGFQPPSPKEKGSGCSFISARLSTYATIGVTG